MNKDDILQRASNPTKNVSRVVAVRIKAGSYEVLEAEAKQAGVKVCDLVRAAIEALCDELKKP